MGEGRKREGGYRSKKIEQDLEFSPKGGLGKGESGGRNRHQVKRRG